MIERLKKYHRFNEVLLMGAMSLFALCLSVFRVIYTGTNGFLFLNWNLFLAFIPWGLTTLCMVFPVLKNHKFTLLTVGLFWLLFFPNAPYILTDLIHLRLHTGMPVWYDVGMIVSYAWTGLLFGLLSLRDIESMVQKYLPRLLAKTGSVLFIFLGSFGVYIGRFLRYNSWDLFRNPENILYDVGHRIAHPLQHPGTWGMTLIFGFFMLLVYISFDVISHRLQMEKA